MVTMAATGRHEFQESPTASAAVHAAGGVIAAEQDHVVWIRGLGVRFLIDGDQTGGRFALVEHPLRPRALGSPLHTHQDEDEYAYVLEGRVGVQIGNLASILGPGAVAVMPRAVPHAFWNAGEGEAPARLLMVLSPAGFERYFAAMAPLLPPAAAAPDLAGIAAIRDRHHLTVDATSVPALTERYGLRPY
jgi:quercetin dioxygenase-like cupin family protein